MLLNYSSLENYVVIIQALNINQSLLEATLFAISVTLVTFPPQNY